MRFIPTRIHGMLDYVIGLALIAAPWLFDFSDGGAKMWVPIILGAGVILYSLFTNYEMSIVDAIPMPVHLALDALGGLFLAVSPWLFGFNDTVWVPHVVVGILEIGAALFTHTVADEDVVRPRDSGRMA
jgi:threonine/homoserine efflux transporter RhtA